MRTSGLPNFRKLWGHIDTDLEKGVYTVRINSNYDALGGDNTFLGIAYIVIGGITLILALAFVISGYLFKKSDDLHNN